MSFGNDFINTVPRMLVDFWYLLLTFFVLVYFLYRFYPKLKEKSNNNTGKGLLSIAGNIFLFLLFTGFTVIGFRGGVQLKPLNVLSASRFGAGKAAELVLNTPFTILKTYGKNKLEEIKWMSPGEADEINPLLKSPDNSRVFSRKNVVLIILESFGKEYIGSLNKYPGYTPFLDSLISRSLVFPNAFANGKRSIEGIPAIIAGIPALMHDPFITSAYSGNSVTSLPLLLKKAGYASAFYHGGTNGTMGFDNFSKLAGYDKYFGRTEYGNDDNFDGNWGIYDEPFLQRVAADMEKLPQPFTTAIFTLSSHHPYKIPEKYFTEFAKGPLPIHQSIRYADYSLKRFFDTVSKMNWFTNTLFVITADHTALSEYPFYRNHVGLFSVPVIYFSPGDSLLTGKKDISTQQIDILPSVMDYLGYPHPYFAFGKSVFSAKKDNYAVAFIDDAFQLIEGKYSFVLDTARKNYLFDFTIDSTLSVNLAANEKIRAQNMEHKLKAVIQQFNYCMIHNSMQLSQ